MKVPATINGEIMSIYAGGASCVINCQIGDGIMGQLHDRKCQKILDNLEANCMFISNGKNSLLIISCDLLFLERPFVQSAASAIEKATGVPSSNIIICCSHTHEGPYTAHLLPDVPLNDRYLDKLRNNLVELSLTAVRNAEEATIGWAKGSAHIGYNRRVCWKDGSHTMYGDTRRPDFCGLEGPDDSDLATFFVWHKGKLALALYNCACHATCMESGEFASADYPGVTRYLIRRAVGNEIPVVFLQGASGDISPWNLMLPELRVDGQQRAWEIGELLAGETMHLAGKAQRYSEATIKSEHEDIKLSVRLPEEKELAQAREIVSKGEKEVGRGAFVLQYGIVQLYEHFKDNPYEICPVHVARIGNFAVSTNPCELYCQFGIDIKQRSPAEITAIAQLANGWIGYCPTLYAVMGGGYSGAMYYMSRLAPSAGYKIVETSSRLLWSTWKN